MCFRKTYGKVKPHAIKRFVKQYVPSWPEGRAKNFLRRFLNGEKTGRIKIPRKALEDEGVRNLRPEIESLFMEINFGTIENVKESRPIH